MRNLSFCIFLALLLLISSCLCLRPVSLLRRTENHYYATWSDRAYEVRLLSPLTATSASFSLVPLDTALDTTSALAVHNGFLYATDHAGGRVLRYDLDESSTPARVGQARAVVWNLDSPSSVSLNTASTACVATRVGMRCYRVYMARTAFEWWYQVAHYTYAALGSSSTNTAVLYNTQLWLDDGRASDSRNALHFNLPLNNLHAPTQAVYQYGDPVHQDTAQYIVFDHFETDLLALFSPDYDWSGVPSAHRLWFDAVQGVPHHAPAHITAADLGAETHERALVWLALDARPSNFLSGRLDYNIGNQPSSSATPSPQASQSPSAQPSSSAQASQSPSPQASQSPSPQASVASTQSPSPQASVASSSAVPKASVSPSAIGILLNDTLVPENATTGNEFSSSIKPKLFGLLSVVVLPITLCVVGCLLVSLLVMFIYHRITRARRRNITLPGAGPAPSATISESISTDTNSRTVTVGLWDNAMSQYTSLIGDNDDF